MLRSVSGSRRLRFMGGVVASALALAAFSGQALADRGGRGGHGGHGGHGHSRGHHHGHSHGHKHGHYQGGYYGGWGECGSSVGFFGGWGGYRSRFGLSVNLGSAYCAPTYYAPSYCPPAVVYRPYYQPTTVVVGTPVVYSTPTVVYQAPAYQAPIQQPAAQSVVYPQQQSQQQPQQPAIQQAQPAPQQQQQAPTAGRYQDRELGDAYLRAADFSNAARVYSRYLNVWSGDGTVLRGHGLALVGQGDTVNGFRSFIQAYKVEPALFDRPFGVADLGGQTTFEGVLDNAARGATLNNTPEAWFTLAMLQHSSGNADAALRSLVRARDGGLEQDLFDKTILRIVPPAR